MAPFLTLARRLGITFSTSTKSSSYFSPCKCYLQNALAQYLRYDSFRDISCPIVELNNILLGPNRSDTDYRSDKPSGIVINFSMASLTLTYILWFFTGWFGLHHVYLDRPFHAFVWFSTFGGCFGVGWLREIFRLPDYVRRCNGDKSYQDRHLKRVALDPQPGCGWARLLGMSVLGLLVSTLLCGAMPDYTAVDKVESPVLYSFYRCLMSAMVIIGSAIGVYVVANIGEFRCSFFYPLIGASLATPWLVYVPDAMTTSTFFAIVLTWWKGLRWRPLRNANSSRRCRTATCYVGMLFLWFLLLTFGFYFKAEVVLNDGEKIPLHVAVSNFFGSPAWERTKDSLYRVYRAVLDGGLKEGLHNFKDVFDISGEATAFKVLDLNRNATEAEIKKRCRTLSRDYHPDRHKLDEEKEKAQVQFISIQQACTMLSKTKSRRATNNKYTGSDRGGYQEKTDWKEKEEL